MREPNPIYKQRHGGALSFIHELKTQSVLNADEILGVLPSESTNYSLLLLVDLSRLLDMYLSQK